MATDIKKPLVDGAEALSVERDASLSHHANIVAALGYTAELKPNRSLWTLLFQTLAIAAIPFGEGAPLISAIYGGGQLAIFAGWFVVLVFAQCVAMSLSELASRYPTSAGPYYWTFQLTHSGSRELLSFVNGWIWLIGNWTITLSVNFGFASLISATVSMYHEDWAATPWQLLLIFYALCIATFVVSSFCNNYLPLIDTICAIWTVISIFVILIALSVAAKAGRHSASYALGNFDPSLSGWGNFSFLIGLLPAAYTFSAIGMISSMAEEVHEPTVKVPWAISLCVPVGGFFGIFFILPICFTLPPLADILLAPSGQALPYIFSVVMGTPGGGLGLIFLVLGINLFCSVSITVAAGRTTWAMARDKAIPLSRVFSKLQAGVPVYATALLTIIQMLLGLIILGSTSAFLAFVSVGVIALAVSYAVPIVMSLLQRRKEVLQARWNLGRVAGPIVNVVAVAYIAFELVLFSMPTALPVTPVTMNYASVVFAGFLVIALVWFAVYARKVYRGPPMSDGVS